MRLAEAFATSVGAALAPLLLLQGVGAKVGTIDPGPTGGAAVAAGAAACVLALPASACNTRRGHAKEKKEVERQVEVSSVARALWKNHSAE